MKKISDVHKLIWDKSYSVKVDELDSQHKKIFEYINLLNDALTSNERSIVITTRDILSELEEHATSHFANEEKYFEKFNYEGAEKHIQEHKAYLSRIGKFKIRLKTAHREQDNMITFALDLYEFLEDWWNHHVIHDDQKYSKCFNEHGLH